MKRRDQLTHARKLALPDLKAEVLNIEKKIQTQMMAVRFGKAKDVSTVKQLKRQLARTLTVAHQALTAANKEKVS
jgi:ribosomal protein L29